MAKYIQVRIGSDGTLKAETHGYKGPECLSVVALLEQLLEASTVASQFTEEYAEEPATLEVEAEETLTLRTDGDA